MGSGSRFDRKKSVSAKKRMSQYFSLGKLLGVVIAVIAVVLVCVGVYRVSKRGLDRMAAAQSRPEQPVESAEGSIPGSAPVAAAPKAPNPWPLPPETPVEGLYGSMPEPIDPCHRETRSQPLRRRKTDPLVRLSNARAERVEIDWRPKESREFENQMRRHMDKKMLEIVQKGDRDFLKKSTRVSIDVTPVEWDNPPESLLICVGGKSMFWIDHSLTQEEFQDLRLGRTTRVTFEDSLIKDTPLQIFAMVKDDRYRVNDTTKDPGVINHLATSPEGRTFKVSQSVFTQQPFHVEAPREWHPEELKLLTTAGGSIKLEFEEDPTASPKPPTGWIVLKDPALPVQLSAPANTARISAVGAFADLGIPLQTITYRGTDYGKMQGYPNAEGVTLTVEWARASVPLSEEIRERVVSSANLPPSAPGERRTRFFADFAKWSGGSNESRYGWYSVGERDLLLIQVDSKEGPLYGWVKSTITKSLRFVEPTAELNPSSPAMAPAGQANTAPASPVIQPGLVAPPPVRKSGPVANPGF